MNTNPTSPAILSNRRRWLVCGMLFAATTINYMDRQILGILAPTLEKDIGWNEVEYAWVVMAFQSAYAVGQPVFGGLIDRFGTRNGYALSVGLWSLAAAAHSLVKSVFGFGVARFALGFGEAGNFPAAVKAVGEWFPQRERAVAIGIFNSGSNVGAIIAPLVVPWLTVLYGWQMSFLALGLVGGVWIVFWHWLVPASCAAGDDRKAKLASVSWRRLLGYRQAWAFIVGISFTAPVWWFYLYWLPKFLHQRHGLDLMSLGLPLVVIYSMTCVGSLAGGWLSSHLLSRGWSLNAARKTAMLVCAACVTPVALAAQSSNLWVAVLLIGLAASAHQGWAANLFAMTSDLFPQRVVASVTGLGGMFGAIAAMAFAQATGLILQITGNYWSLFAIASGAYFAALAIMHILTPRMTPAELDGAGDRQ
jgi:MFS transporter, ACS family, hexuronate transporter